MTRSPHTSDTVSVHAADDPLPDPFGEQWIVHPDGTLTWAHPEGGRVVTVQELVTVEP